MADQQDTVAAPLAPLTALSLLPSLTAVACLPGAAARAVPGEPEDSEPAEEEGQEGREGKDENGQRGEEEEREERGQLCARCATKEENRRKEEEEKEEEKRRRSQLVMGYIPSAHEHLPPVKRWVEEGGADAAGMSGRGEGVLLCEKLGRGVVWMVRGVKGEVRRRMKRRRGGGKNGECEGVMGEEERETSTGEDSGVEMVVLRESSAVLGASVLGRGLG